MKLSPQEFEALCEFVDGRRAAGDRYDQIAEALEPYAVTARAGEEPRMSVAEIDGIEQWHGVWKKRQAFKQRQRASGDVRGGSGGVAEVAMRDPGCGIRDAKGEEVKEVEFARRCEALTVVLFLQKALLGEVGRWTYLETRAVQSGVEATYCKGPGSVAGPDGEVEWLVSAVVFRVHGMNGKQGNEGNARVVEVLPECRVRDRKAPGWNGFSAGALRLERFELDEKRIDLRGLSARLAAVIHTYLGPSRSGFRNNEDLAQHLGVTREAMRVRKRRIMQAAGSRVAEGLAPNRANGGRKGAEVRASRGNFKLQTPSTNETEGSVQGNLQAPND